MTSDTPVRDYLLPRLAALVDDAVAEGAERSVAVAVLIDLITSSTFDTAAPDATAGSSPHPDYERAADDPVMINGVVAAGPGVIGAQDEADFLAPARWDR